MGIRSDLQSQLRRLLNSDIIKGKVSVQRAYADWRRYPQYIVPLSEASIDLIFAPAFGANKKNATDIRLAIDALELVFIRPEIGVFILLSGDSDFSALVLKLREYGKFVIGVGIRESSSDLLIQNCDEYYSYNELTGLSKEGEIEHVRKDPWELVVEAAGQMESDGDVMRSDRLKQVMQSIDPNFDERDAGFNRFSKFVVAAGQRGLLKLTRMDNGQYAVQLGANANVPIEDTASPPTRKAERPVEKPRKRGGRKPAEQAAAQGLTLIDSFALLRRALTDLGALGDESADAEGVRSKMIELHGSDSDPGFDRRRFPRMLRQAHDADLIDLIKGEDGGYILKLSASAVAEAAAPGESGEAEAAAETAARKPVKKRTRTTKRKTTARARSPEAGHEPEESQEGVQVAELEAAAGTEKRPAKRRASTTRAAKRSTSRTKTRESTSEPADAAAKEAIAEPAEKVEEQTHATESRAVEGVRAEEKAKKATKRSRTSSARSPRSRARTSTKADPAEPPPSEEVSADTPGGVSGSAEHARRNPRYRRGSRGTPPRGRPAETGTEETSDSPVDAAAKSAAKQVHSDGRSLGMRRGSRRGRSARPSDEASTPAEAAEPKSEVVTEKSLAKVEEPNKSEPRVAEPDKTPATSAMAEEETRDSGGLFKRITAAFQRAVQGEEEQGGDG
jgi:uncharacterized LabA/DUF88 family protein